MDLRASHQQLKEENLASITSKGDPGKVSTAMRLMTMLAFAFLQHRRVSMAVER
jgi:hypothetical protein